MFPSVADHCTTAVLLKWSYFALPKRQHARSERVNPASKEHCTASATRPAYKPASRRKGGEKMTSWWRGLTGGLEELLGLEVFGGVRKVERTRSAREVRIEGGGKKSTSRWKA